MSNVPTLQTREVEFLPLGEATAIKLSIAQLRLAGIVRPTRSGKEPDDGTVMTFMLRCKAQALNPFVGDAFLLGYDSQNGPEFSLVTAVQSLYKRAELSPAYDGMESGVIVLAGDELIDLPGDFVPPGTKCVGGWAKAWRKDRTRPCCERLNMEPYAKPTSLWKQNPQGQIVKCAEASVLRRMFPTTCGGLYLSDEMPDTVVQAVQTATEGRTAQVESALRKRLKSSAEQSQPAQPTPPARDDRSSDYDGPTADELARDAAAIESGAESAASGAAAGDSDTQPPALDSFPWGGDFANRLANAKTPEKAKDAGDAYLATARRFPGGEMALQIAVARRQAELLPTNGA